MQIIVEVPGKLPDAVHCTPQQFEQEAKMAMAVKLYEMKRLSSGMAASLVGMRPSAISWRVASLWSCRYRFG